MAFRVAVLRSTDLSGGSAGCLLSVHVAAGSLGALVARELLPGGASRSGSYLWSGWAGPGGPGRAWPAGGMAPEGEGWRLRGRVGGGDLQLRSRWMPHI